MEESSESKRDLTVLDKSVLRYQKGKKYLFRRIYHEIYPTVFAVSRKYLFLFPDKTIEDLIQDAYLHISCKVISKYNPERGAGFKTFVTASITNKFRTMIKEISDKEKQQTGISAITFTQYEIDGVFEIADIEDGKDIFDEVLINDFLRLFKKRLTKESWSIYWQLYRSPKSNFKKMAKQKGVSMKSLYRKCNSIYNFLSMIIEKEQE